MTAPRTSFFARHRRDESGVAIVAVVGLSMVMLLLVAVSLSFSTSGMAKSRTDQDSAAALAAAYAGADEYSSRLSNDSTYEKYGDPTAPFTRGTASSALVTLPTTTATNPAFGVGEGGTWADVAGTSGRASFRYEVDNSHYSTQGILRLRVTGRVGSTTRSVVANLKQDGFIKFLYFTDYEMSDPQLSSTACTPTHAVVHDTDCVDIQFAGVDRLHGPIHSNDTMRICGTTFSDTVSSAMSPGFVDACGTTITWKAGDTGPKLEPSLGMPATNGNMKNETRIDLTADVPRPGCMYTGPTTITFLTSGGVGQMRVVSPWTKVTRPSKTAGTPSQTPVECGLISDLNSAQGALVTVPDQNLIFVQNVPSDPADPNSWQIAPLTPSGVTCLPSGANGGWKYTTGTGSAATTVQFPIPGETPPTTSTSTYPAYDCKHGDVFVKGTVKGAVTVAAENYVYVTGDLVYNDVASDVLGLVGQNTVWVWNPMSSVTDRSGTTTYTSIAPTDPTPAVLSIDAAILSVDHTFQVQNHTVGGSRGDLYVLGAIAQKFRGPVATGSATISSGFAKKYWYDERFGSIAPPKFLTPTSTTYGVTQYVDVSTAFTSTGATAP